MDAVDMGVISFLAPKFYARMKEAERQSEVSTFRYLQKHEKPEAWDPLKTKFRKRLWLDAKTWNPVQLFDSKPMTGLPGERIKAIEEQECVVSCPGGPRWKYVNHTLPATHPLSILQNKRRGEVYFSADAVTPVLCEKLPGEKKPRVWMSITPAECLTQRPGIRRAKGRVVIGGLGLGWFLNEVCLRPSVTEVILVEKEEALLDWLLPVIQEKYPATTRVRYVCDDIYEYMNQDVTMHAGTRYLLDIWSSFGGCDRKFYEWKKRLTPGQLWGWGDVEF